jgi:hypothetical protein
MRSDLCAPPWRSDVVPIKGEDRRVVAIVLGATRFPDWPAIDDEAVGRAFGTSHQDIVAVLRTFTSAILDLFDSNHLPDRLCLDIEDFLKDHCEATDLLVYYVGHGSFLGDSEPAYFLALRKTAVDREYATGLRAINLARSLRIFKKRTYLLLDCCFAGSALPDLQSPLQDVMGADFKAGPQPKGVALLSAASRNKAAIIPKSAGRTMFSDALCDVFRDGIAAEGPFLTLRQIKEAIVERIQTKFATEAHVLPEVHTPRQVAGDVADFPFFPNAAADVIPRDVLANLERPERWARVSAVGALVELLMDGRPNLVHAARGKLEQLVGDDSRHIAQLASEGLAKYIAAKKKIGEEQKAAHLAAEQKVRQEPEEEARHVARKRVREKQEHLEAAKVAQEQRARFGAERFALEGPERLAAGKQVTQAHVVEESVALRGGADIPSPRPVARIRVPARVSSADGATSHVRSRWRATLGDMIPLVVWAAALGVCGIAVLGARKGIDSLGTSPGLGSLTLAVNFGGMVWTGIDAHRRGVRLAWAVMWTAGSLLFAPVFPIYVVARAVQRARERR